MIQLTPDLRLLLAPSATYREVCTLAADASRWTLVARVSIAPLIAGTVTGLSATGRVSWSLLLSGVVCWSFLAVVQLMTATLLVGREGRSIGYSRALDLFFLGHAAWSLWLIAAGAYLFAVPDAMRREVPLMTAIVPVGWTAAVIFAYCREVLRLATRRAAVRTAVHQGLTVLTILAYVAWGVQLWPRLLAPTLSLR